MTPLRLLIILISFTLITALSLYIYVSGVISTAMPSTDNLDNPRQFYSTRVISGDGEMLDMYSIERRINQPVEDIPEHFISGLVAVEDRKFFSHWGVDVERIFKAAIKNLMAGRVREGASTITQQLARNLFLNQKMSYERKIREAFTAMEIERKYTKREILGMYTNTVNFGRGAYGIRVASQLYFDKTPEQLTLAECAFLVGILKAPEHYNGLVNYDKAINRRNLVLRLMQKQNKITYDDFAEAVQEPITLYTGKLKKTNRSYLAPHFVEMLRQDFRKDRRLEKYDLYRDGLTVYTTLNSRLQAAANEAVSEHMEEFQKDFMKTWRWNRHRDLLKTLINEAIEKHAEYKNATAKERNAIKKRLKKNKKFIDSVKNAATTVQCALVVIDPCTGKILALVGASPKFMEENPDAKYSLNHATQIKRQPGSSFKPLVYTSALQQGMTPESIVECGPFSYELPTGDIWEPRGTGHCTEGEVRTLYQALISSINTVSARLITEHTDPYNVIGVARRMGIKSRLLPVPALSLGAGGEVTPLEMVSAYGAFPNKGIHIKPYSVERIEDKFGNTIYEKRSTIEATDVMSEKIAEQMIFMMQGVVDHGTGRRARKYFEGVEAGGKTGTTNDYADAWFIGYTPQLVAGVWVGFDDRRVTFQTGMGYAAVAAAPIWGRVMNKIYSDKSLPYKQKEFAFRSDTASVGSFDEVKQRLQSILNGTDSTLATGTDSTSVRQPLERQLQSNSETERNQ